MTDAIRCPICARRDPRVGLTVCDTCLGRLDDDLARIVELTRLAAGWLSPRANGSDGGHTVPGSRPPLSVAALDAAIGHDALGLLESWDRMTREHFGLCPYGPAYAHDGATVGGCATFLRSWLLRAAEDALWPIEDYAREIRDQRIALERLDPDHDRPDGIRVPCPADGPEADGRDCGYRLTVDARRPADDVCCPRCRTTWTSGRLILVALNDAKVTIWAYPADIEDALGIPKRTLQRWAQDGTVRRRGTQYDVGAAFRTRHTEVRA